MDVTMVVTACDRLDLLEVTLRSFLKYNTYPFRQIVIKDDSGQKSAYWQTLDLIHELGIQNFSLLPNFQIGQARSIDMLMDYVTTPAVFHCEDDWEFTGDFLPPAMAVLDEGVAQVRGRHKDDHIEGVFKFTDEYAKNGIMVREVLENHLFSWNPHVRIVNHQKFDGQTETTLGEQVKKSGLKTLWLEDGFYRHIGYEKPTNRAGTPYEKGIKKA